MMISDSGIATQAKGDAADPALRPFGWQLDIAWLEAFSALLPSIDVVSFDIFDTTLTRMLDSPVDVFARVEEKLVAHIGGDAIGFAAKRETAEAEARLSLHALTGLEEVDLDQIYDRLSEAWPVLAPHATLAKQVEIDTEQEVLAAVPDIGEAIRMARASGKRIVFTSDIYHSGETVARLLAANGIREWSDLFVSSELRATKSSGAIWHHVGSKVGPLERVLHVGDDAWSDVERPRSHGVMTLAYIRARSERRTGAALSPEVIAYSRAARSAAIALRAKPGEAADAAAFYTAFGRGFGTLVVGTFVHWLAERARRLEIEHIYFCARDGHLIQTVWDSFGFGRRSGITSSYLYISRRPLNLAAGARGGRHGTLPEDLVRFLLPNGPPQTLRTVLGRASLLEEAATVCDAEAVLGSLDTIVSWRDEQALRDFFSRHADRIISVARTVQEATIGYLVQEGLAGSRRAALVDLGWHGSLQASIRQLLRPLAPQQRLAGFYYGLWPTAKGRRPAAGLMESLFASDFRPFSEQTGMRNAVDILEELHAAPHGSVVSYARAADGRWAASLGESATERWMHQTFLTPFQAAVADSARQLASEGRSCALSVGDLTPENARAAIDQLVLSPTSEEMNWLGQLQHAQGFDHAEFAPLLPEQFPVDRLDDLAEAIAHASWPVAHARRLLALAPEPQRALVREAAHAALGHLGDRRLRFLR